jgi:dolichyl-phosphate beta-glucosyltransferase
LDVSLIVPAYNEADRVGPSLSTVDSFLQGCSYSHEVLVVDDGSKDRTPEIVQDFIDNQGCRTRFRLIRYETNRGKGYAVARGLREARGKFLAFSDTDLSAPIDQLPLLIEALEAGADVAIGSRRMPGSEVIGMPWHRETMGLFFSLLSRLLVLPGVRDTQCGFKAYRREAALKLIQAQKIDGYTFDVEHLLLARRMGLAVVETPVKWVYTAGSQIDTFRDSIEMFRDLLALRRLHGD